MFGENSAPYKPSEDAPEADELHFPRGSDLETWELVLETMKKFEGAQDLGIKASKKHQLSGDSFKEHPWKGGRNLAQSKKDWLKDSFWTTGKKPKDLKRFMQCFEPRLVSPICPYCQPAFISPEPGCDYEDNTGEIWEYWWPEWEIEINSWGIVAINPALVGQEDLLAEAFEAYEAEYRPDAEEYLKQTWGVNANKANIPNALRKKPHLGNSQHAGINPLDSTYVQEAHVYRTNMAQRVSELRPKGDGIWDSIYIEVEGLCIPIPFWYNGYKKGHERCFYDTTPQKTKTIIGLTEQAKYELFWRLPEFSALLDKEKFEASMPKGVSDEDYWKSQSCGSYRSQKWESTYGDLQSAIGIEGSSSSALGDICYRGGGQLYPATGTLTRQFSELPASAYLARRAIEVLAHLKKKQGKGVPHFADKKRGSDSIDKLQRVYPKPSRCFQIQEIDERDDQLFPKDGIDVDSLGSKRYVYWNKRQVCTCPYRGVVSPKEDKGNDKGWGCQIYPKDKPKIGDGDEKKSKLKSWLGWPKQSWPFWAESAEQLYDFNYKY